MAVVLDEPRAGACIGAMKDDSDLTISAATMAEALIVADRGGVGERMRGLVGELGFEVVSVSPADSERVAAAYSRWGKGVHPARLNLGDCFAYALAKERGCPLLYVGDDFSQTDIVGAL